VKASKFTGHNGAKRDSETTIARSAIHRREARLWLMILNIQQLEITCNAYPRT